MILPINEIDFNQVTIGSKVSFLYTKQANHNAKGIYTEPNKCRIKLKSDYFINMILTEFTRNYDDKLEKIAKQQVDLQSHWYIKHSAKNMLESIKKFKKDQGIQRWDKFNKIYPSHAADKLSQETSLEQSTKFIKDYIEKEPKPRGTAYVFFKHYSIDKKVDLDNCYECCVYYAGKSLNLNTGKISHLFISDEGEINKDDFYPELMELV